MGPQLPIAWYFDPAIHARLVERLFDGGPRYVGHELMVPAEGDYRVPEHLEGGQVLVRNGGGASLISNVCRHRQAAMLEGGGNASAQKIVCPIHRWTYDLDGTLLHAPHFPENPCLHLARTPLQGWNGLLFQGPRDVTTDLAGVLNRWPAFDFADYSLDRIWVDRLPASWLTFMEVYLDNYHVAPFHPGLGHFVDTAALAWDLGERYSVQAAGIYDRLSSPGTPVYRKWHDHAIAHGARGLQYGAIWLAYYPNVMLEWYPESLVLSTVWPTGVEACLNVVEFYHPRATSRDFREAQQAAYVESAVEDGEICRRIHAGRKALARRGADESGPYQLSREQGMQHFHAFVRREAHLPQSGA